MAQIPRQSIDELIAKYELHPTLFDVYVEGDFDRDFIFQYLDATGRRADVSVYAIDAIEVPAEMVTAAGLGAGSNKSRVLALARILAARLQYRPKNIVCIADADLDRLFGSLRVWDLVTHTDFTCMEMYVLTEQSLRKFLHFTCKLSEAAATEFVALASRILPTQFCMRAVVEALGLGVPTPALGAGLTSKRDLSTFSDDRYLESFLQTNGLTKRRDEIETLLGDLHGRLDKDLRHKANGHDFVDLLFEFSWLRGGVRLHSKERDVTQFGARLVASGLDFQELSSRPLFSKLHPPAVTPDLPPTGVPVSG